MYENVDIHVFVSIKFWSCVLQCTAAKYKSWSRSLQLTEWKYGPHFIWTAHSNWCIWWSWINFKLFNCMTKASVLIVTCYKFVTYKRLEIDTCIKCRCKILSDLILTCFNCDLFPLYLWFITVEMKCLPVLKSYGTSFLSFRTISFWQLV